MIDNDLITEMSLAEYYAVRNSNPNYTFEYVDGKTVKSEVHMFGTEDIQRNVVDIIKNFIRKNNRTDLNVEQFKDIEFDAKNILCPCIAVYKEGVKLPLVVMEVVLSPRDLFNAMPVKSMCYRDHGIKEEWIIDVRSHTTQVIDRVAGTIEEYYMDTDITSPTLGLVTDYYAIFGVIK